MGAGKLSRRAWATSAGGEELSSSKPDTNNTAMDEAAMSTWGYRIDDVESFECTDFNCGWPRVVLGNRGWGGGGGVDGANIDCYRALAQRLPASLVIGTLKTTASPKPP